MTNEAFFLLKLQFPLVAKLKAHGYIPTDTEHATWNAFKFSNRNKVQCANTNSWPLEELWNTTFHSHPHHQSHLVLHRTSCSPKDPCKCFLLQIEKVIFNYFQHISSILCFNCCQCWTSGSCTWIWTWTFNGAFKSIVASSSNSCNAPNPLKAVSGFKCGFTVMTACLILDFCKIWNSRVLYQTNFIADYNEIGKYISYCKLGRNIWLTKNSSLPLRSSYATNCWLAIPGIDAFWYIPPLAKPTKKKKKKASQNVSQNYTKKHVSFCPASYNGIIYYKENQISSHLKSKPSRTFPLQNLTN